jgi:sulfur relay (sulfurtransferase) complex TusBCD TusD component (DsrE family)
MDGRLRLEDAVNATCPWSGKAVQGDSLTLYRGVVVGYYNTGRMAAGFARLGGETGCCGTCMDARGMSDDRLVKGAHRSSMKELTEWTLWADKVINV